MGMLRLAVEQRSMNYVKAILSGLAALFVAFVLISWPLFRDAQKQNAAIGMGIFVRVLSPVFWALAVIVFALLFAASRIGNRLLTVFLFWIPAGVFSTLGIAILGLFTYVFILLKHP